MLSRTNKSKAHVFEEILDLFRCFLEQVYQKLSSFPGSQNVFPRDWSSTSTLTFAVTFSTIPTVPDAVREFMQFCHFHISTKRSGSVVLRLDDVITLERFVRNCSVCTVYSLPTRIVSFCLNQLMDMLVRGP